jgi:hypothetical protein
MFRPSLVSQAAAPDPLLELNAPLFHYGLLVQITCTLYRTWGLAGLVRQHEA